MEFVIKDDILVVMLVKGFDAMSSSNFINKMFIQVCNMANWHFVYFVKWVGTPGQRL